jgi:hypothetical protein
MPWAVLLLSAWDVPDTFRQPDWGIKGKMGKFNEWHCPQFGFLLW